MDATKRGQHQLPTRAGIEIKIAAIATNNGFLLSFSPTAVESSATTTSSSMLLLFNNGEDSLMLLMDGDDDDDDDDFFCGVGLAQTPPSQSSSPNLGILPKNDILISNYFIT
ncbi:hypothetical protein DFA_08026 [Cavenderia fasciculata]|uniref:Uncharacterized protein n=1 Tax=Cavenderia fasciculata TaxID=261658 RepID=F4Q4N6_CACFS|nr:uncharacterized protein DFA_08026 [Cavenderia fasciculata]EGG17045.1 hypothetical protein DFA_08026 [Cavenderia fasciculata]|eukprot:XP_004355529.1 hypothetical protein DFA_08026 [Cavenderia fasciculata]